MTISSDGYEKSSSERGATLLEFSLAATVLFLLLSLVMDIGIILHRYSILTHAVNVQGRQAANSISEDVRSLSGAPTCAQIESLAASYLPANLMLQRYQTYGNYSFKIAVTPDESIHVSAAAVRVPARLKIIGQYLVDNAFLTNLAAGWKVGVETETTLDAPNFANKCCGVECGKTFDCSKYDCR